MLDRTPFYAESGGQVGDTGYLTAGGEKLRIVDTKKENDLIVHITEHIPQNPHEVFEAVVDRGRRDLTQNNHSATHLLHAALRQVLGDHVQQKGSLVNDKILRFDFSHFAKLTEEEILRIEEIVNSQIRKNIQLTEEVDIPLEEAKQKGAMALFGEKYADKVRVITFDPQYSVELCGGTHVKATGQIGLFKIISEGSVSAGVRRIEAITAKTAEDWVRHQQEQLEEIKLMLKNPKNITHAISQLLDERNKLQKALAEQEQKAAGTLKDELANKAEEINGMQVIIDQVSVPSGEVLKTLAFELRQKVNDLFLVLAANVNGEKPQVAVMIADHLVKEKNLHAGNIVKELAKEIKGGGGGQPFFATAGGKDLEGLPNVVSKAKDMLN